MKNIYIIVIAALMLAGCSESFLDTEPLTKKVDANFYQTPEDASLALTAAYAVLPGVTPSQTFYLTAELMSDDRFAGGGVNDIATLATDAFKMSEESQYESAWSAYYQGIFRANMLIQKLDQVEWESEDQKGDIAGQVYFLRGLFYSDMARMFGQVPLIVETAPLNIPKTSPDSIWAQVASDLKKAIEYFPSVNANNIPNENFGRATKWSAEALMARAWLFYTGYYQKAEMPLAEGGSITKDQVITWIDDCVANSGHKLMPEFRNLWPYSHSKDYKYKVDNNLSWYGEEGANKETVYAIPFSNLADWATSIYYSSQYNLYQGIRLQTLVPFGQGWGMGTVNPQLWESWDDSDIRKRGSICDVNDANEGIYGYDSEKKVVGYVWGSDKQMHETGYWSKKYMPINEVNSTGTVINISNGLYGTQNNFQLNNTQDMVIIRYADILLMGAELGGPNAQSYLDQVRSRVGLPSVPATLENIKAERRYELAFEGVRYHDILRWHDAESLFNNSQGIPCFNEGLPATYSASFRPETGGFLPIPNSQILLSNGVLTQNPGWTGSEALNN